MNEEVDSRRSWLIEVIGIFSAVAFFVGVFFAYQTYAAGLVTQREFDHLRSGLTPADVDSELGLPGRRVEATASESNAADVYRWENSTLSYVECEFVDRQLVSKKAVELPR